MRICMDFHARLIDMWRRISLLFIIAVFLCLHFSGVAGAHDISRSESKIEVQGRSVRVDLRINLLELRYVDVNGDSLISYNELDGVIDRVYGDIRRNYTLRSPDLPVQVTLQQYSVVEDHVLDAVLLYVFPQDV